MTGDSWNQGISIYGIDPVTGIISASASEGL